MAIAEAPDQRLLERWRAVFENVPYVITDFDRDGRILITNSFPGRKLSEVVGRVVYDIIPEHLHARLRRCIEGVFESGETTSIENHIVTDRELVDHAFRADPAERASDQRGRDRD